MHGILLRMCNNKHEVLHYNLLKESSAMFQGPLEVFRLILTFQRIQLDQDFNLLRAIAKWDQSQTCT